jgi:hypothetical protein
MEITQLEEINNSKARLEITNMQTKELKRLKKEKMMR